MSKQAHDCDKKADADRSNQSQLRTIWHKRSRFYQESCCNSGKDCEKTRLSYFKYKEKSLSGEAQPPAGVVRVRSRFRRQPAAPGRALPSLDACRACWHRLGWRNAIRPALTPADAPPAPREAT
jgi:hypothetical protein